MMSVGAIHNHLPDPADRIRADNIEIVRYSLWLDSQGNLIPMNNITPSYIPKEPTKVSVFYLQKLFTGQLVI